MAILGYRQYRPAPERIFLSELVTSQFKETRTEKTLASIHYAGSWHSKKQKRGFRFGRFFKKGPRPPYLRIIEKLFANDFYYKIKKQLKKMNDGKR
jgi:hypothetical protein